MMLTTVRFHLPPDLKITLGLRVGVMSCPASCKSYNSGCIIHDGSHGSMNSHCSTYKSSCLLEKLVDGWITRFVTPLVC